MVVIKKNSEMKLFWHLLIHLLVISVFLTACKRNPNPIPVENLDTWKQTLNKHKPKLFDGNWNEAELAWRELKDAIEPKNLQLLEVWIDLQVEIVDETTGDSEKLLLRRLALQELEFYPEVSIKYYDWAHNKYDNNEFSDLVMQEHLTLLLERFAQIAKKEDNLP